MKKYIIFNDLDRYFYEINQIDRFENEMPVYINDKRRDLLEKIALSNTTDLEFVRPIKADLGVILSKEALLYETNQLLANKWTTDPETV